MPHPRTVLLASVVAAILSGASAAHAVATFGALNYDPAAASHLKGSVGGSEAPLPNGPGASLPNVPGVNVTVGKTVSQTAGQDVSSGLNYDPGFGSDPSGVSGAIPEPAIWTTMLLGFGAVGAALRAKRRATA